ncbi:hypothetical protein [Inquilinus sp. Marseille-Q2685]|uniref:hypothetical protein n=1 Tax=Inquilinus sp. Marseille-Q2685 TaxID=2866581 RepID=UPI001CE4641C|nr:hypothetical protein [Inquilinus sp. Marseille-Q2685]
MNGQRAGRPRGTLLIWINLIVVLFPPIHLAFAAGNLAMALGFFLGSSLLLTGTVIILNRANHEAGEE